MSIMLLALKQRPTAAIVLDVNDGVMKLPNRTFCALCLKFRGIVATVYHYFEGADSNYRLGCLRSIFKALAINTV